MICPKCNAEAGDAKFCPECGNPMQESGTSSTSEVKTQKKKSKKKIIVLIIIAVIVLAIGGIFLGKGIKENQYANRPAQEISFETLVQDFIDNGALADEKYNGQKFIFYLTVYSIDDDGVCTGEAYDSYHKEFDLPAWGNATKAGELKFELGEQAKTIEKYKTYKIEGELYYHSFDSNTLLWPYVRNITSIEEVTK